MGTDQLLDEYLPILYRVALDALDALARRGSRSEAVRLRAMAVKAYSRAWDGGCRKTLEIVIRRAHEAAGTEAPSFPIVVGRAASSGTSPAGSVAATTAPNALS